MPTCCLDTCHSRNAFTPPLFFLFNQLHSPTRSSLPPTWVMACVDFLSLWEVVLHGLALSSCFLACPFNRLGNPSWYLYRPWFSWYRCSPPSFLHCNLSYSLPPSRCVSRLAPSPLTPALLHFVYSMPDNVFFLSSVNIFQFILPSHFPYPPPKNAPSSSETVKIPLNSDQS